jgi:hypothetical protein
MLPYSAEVLYALYGQYNQAIWPIQILFLVLAGVSLAFTLHPWRQAGRVVGMILVLAWLWAAIGFHWQHFSLINFSAGIYAALFAAQALLIAWTWVARGGTSFHLDRDVAGAVAVTVIICALVVYPALDWLAGYSWPQWRLFGVAPGPTMLFTLGIMLLAQPRAHPVLVVIPALGLVIEAWSAWVLGMPQDLLPAVVAGIALVWLLGPGRLARARNRA